MKMLALILSFGFLYAQTPAQWLPRKYQVEAVKYYDKLDSAQWGDVRWHIRHHGTRQAVFAGMEGSNRPRGKHNDEDSYQDVGVYYPTARLFRPVKGLYRNLKSHSFTAQLSAEIDSCNLAIEYKRNSIRPELNAAMRYPGGSKWRDRLVYGMVFIARVRELKRRLIIQPDGSKF